MNSRIASLIVSLRTLQQFSRISPTKKSKSPLVTDGVEIFAKLVNLIRDGVDPELVAVDINVD
jgi:hypothetical protein